MSSRYERETIVVVECFRYVLAEGISCATRADTPSAAIVWVGPEQIAHRTFVGHFLYPVETADVVKGVDGWRETAVETEDLVVD